MKIPTLVSGRVDPTKQGLAPVQVAGVSPQAFGAGVWQAAGNLGNEMVTAGVLAADREDKHKNFDVLRRFSQFEVEVNEDQTELKRSYDPSGRGFYTAAEERFRKKEQEFLASIPDENKRKEFAVRTQQVAQRLSGTNLDYQFKAMDASEKQGLNDEFNRAKATVNSSPEEHSASLARMQEALDRSGLPQTEKLALRRAIDQGLASVKYKALVKNGELNGVNAPIGPSAAIVADAIIGAESSNDPAAKNPRSSATGLGQFTNRTWVETLRRERPDLAAGQPDEMLYALRLDPKLSRDMTIAYATQNAKVLQQAGFAPSPSNIYLAHFLGPTGAQRILAANDGQRVENLVSSDAFSANKEVFAQAQTVGELKDWARQKMGVVPQFPPITATRNAEGYWVADGVQYELGGKVRAEPVSREYIEKVVPVIKSLDPSLGIKITSAGQKPGHGTGSHRHDVGPNGEALTSDFVLTKDGKPVTPAEAPDLYAKAIEGLAAQGFTGIGHYSWGLHVGGGSKAFWGPEKNAASADPKFLAAANRGWAKTLDSKRDALDTDMTYASIPFEDRVTLRADAEREAKLELVQGQKQREADRTLVVNNLQNAILDGTAGQTDLDRLVQRGVISDADERLKVQRLIDKVTEDTSALANAQAKIGNPTAVWDPTNKEDKDGLNLLVGKQGLQALAEGNKDFVTQGLIPLVQRASDIPTDVIGTLMGMVRSSNVQQSMYALDTLAQLQRTDFRAYDQRVPADLARDVEFWNQRKGTMSQEELFKAINGGNSQEERQAKEVMRKQAQDILAKKEGGVSGGDNLVKAVIDNYDGWFSPRPNVYSLPWAARALNKAADALFVEAYTRHGNVDAATKDVITQLKRTWDVTELGGSPQLMEYPPEKVGYRALGGSHKWIGEQARKELGLKPTETFEFFSDDQTRQEFMEFQRNPGARPPSYRFIVKDENGVSREKLRPDGLPIRLNFKPDPEVLRSEIDRKQEESDAKANRAFTRDFYMAERAARRSGVPVPQELVEENAVRQRRQAEIEAARAQRRMQAPPVNTGVGRFSDILGGGQIRYNVDTEGNIVNKNERGPR